MKTIIDIRRKETARQTSEAMASMRTEAFLADCAGAWSGSEFDGVEEELMSTRTSREVVQI